MIWQNYQLENTILQANEDLTLWQTEKGKVQIDKNTLAIQIKLGDQQKGYVFHGHGKLLLDAIVETAEGAIGESVEEEISSPFLMLGEVEEIQRHLDVASKEGLTEMGYQSENEFMAKAKALLSQFLGKGRVFSFHCHGDNHYGYVFAFQNETDKLDILVSKGSKLVYKTVNKVFVSSKNKIVLKTPNEVILTNDRKSYIIKKSSSHCLR